MKQARYFAVSSLIALLAAGAITPAHSAAIRNGVSCKSAGTITQVAGESYKCAKNPYIAPTKLTWTWVGCLSTQASYLLYNKKLTLAKAAPKSDENDAQVSNLSNSVDYLKGLAKDSCSKGR